MSLGPIPQQARAILESARNVYISGCASEIIGAPGLLDLATSPDMSVTGVFSPLLNHLSYADAARGRRVRIFLLTKALRKSMAEGLVDHCPWRYNVIDPWLSAEGRFDTAIVMVSPPDAAGLCSLGPQTDFFPSFRTRVGRVIGVVNPHMPQATAGDAAFPFSALDAVIDYDAPLLEMAPIVPDAATSAVADRVVELVRDGATLQFGVGQIPSQVLKRLRHHRGLQVHSGIVDDNVLELHESGALEPGVPVVTGTAVGTRALYDALADGERFAMRAVAFTHDIGNITARAGFTAINSVLKADLFGQVAAEAADGRIIATPGGLPDFARAAMSAPGGRSIVALRAASVGGRSPGILPILGEPGLVTLGGVDADVVVTEYGVAELRNLPLDARAEAMVGIAAPEDRDALEQAWRAIRASAVGSAGRA